MTPLRRRMTEDLILHDLLTRTSRLYIKWVADFARHFHTSPDRLGAEHVRSYLLHPCAAFERGRLRFPGHLAALARPRRFHRLLAETVRTEWVVYAKPPFQGRAETVLKYLARYTHRAAISDHRLISLVDGQVTFR